MSETNTKTATRSAKPTTKPPKAKRKRNHRATAKSDETRRNIIAAALRCFRRDGYFRTNVSSVAKEAGVTRGCLQYYFETTEDLLRNAAIQVVDQSWQEFSERLAKCPPDKDLLEFQLDVSFDAASGGMLQILIELMAASRTEPLLRPILRDAMSRFDERRIQLTGELFGDAEIGHTRNFRTASDLAVMASTGLAVYVLPDPVEERRDEFKKVVREEVYRLWGVRPQSKTPKK